MNIITSIKKFLLLFVFSLVSLCSMGQTKPDPNALYNAVKSRVTAIYSDALKNSRGCEKKYFTFELYYMWLQEQTRSKGEIGAIDYDIWCQSQDPYQPKATIEDVLVTSQTSAMVRVAVKDGSTRRVILTLKHENNNWFIDELEDAGGSLRARLGGNNTSNTSTSSSNWQFGNYKDEFGDAGERVIGAGVKTEYGSTVGILITKNNMTFDCTDCAPLGMGYDSRLSIKKSDGAVVRVPVSVKGKSLVIYNYSTIQDLVNIFEQGNFKISIQNAIDMNDGADQTYNVTVKGELKGVRNAMSQWIK